MAKRRINAPGIEVNEIDRSNYDETVDNSTIGTATLVLGFADKGEDYSVKWINTLNTFIRNYGLPTNEAEKYFYNAVFEVLQNNGVCYISKLPYKNDSYGKYVYTTYKIDSLAKDIAGTYLSCVTSADNSLTSYAELQNVELSFKPDGLMDYDEYDKLLLKQQKVSLNTLKIVDITRGQYQKDTFGNQILGIMPVIVTPANALFYQEMIGAKTNDNLQNYSPISFMRNSYRLSSNGTAFVEDIKQIDATAAQVSSFDSPVGEKENIQGILTNDFVGIGEYLGCEQFNDGTKVTINDYTVSQYVSEQFPKLRYMGEFDLNRLERKYLTQIGIVVLKVVKDAANENKLSFQAVESFIGSLDPWAKDEDTGANIFIDDVVNNNSDYINVFSNANIQQSKSYDKHALKNASILAIKQQTGVSMGFYERDMKKDIEIGTSIYDAMLRIFEKSEDKNTLDVDLICDAGVTNIAQFVASVYSNGGGTSLLERKGEYNPELSGSIETFKLNSTADVAMWQKVATRFDDFAKNTRKDLLFIADGPRPLCLEGNQKIIRRTQPTNTMKKSILPKMRYISGILNSSYSTGYLNWFYSLDHSTGNYMWMPPSIKALGVYYYTDIYGAYWDAPAGLNRGKIRDTLDVAFNPTNEEAGDIYINSWNYAVNYPLEGIVLEGQRTFQTLKTALDRVNVRRLMLGLEKQVRNFCKYFNYEGNTEFQRSRMKDIIDRYLEQVRVHEGISQYIVVCDERNNNETTIENNELHIAIAVRPIKTIEFIVLQFIATNQSVSVEEAVAAELGV